MGRDDSDTRLHVALLGVGLAVLAWSGIGPHDRFIWFLEVAPAVIAALVLAATYRRFRLSTLVYVLVLLHAIVLMIGGHWTYAEVPLFNWLRDTFSLQRNYYDRLGHVAQGFVPAIAAREVLLRTSSLRRGKWLFVIAVSICLACSAVYELIEWAVAVAVGEQADAFLGTQGDQWDTQWDMFLALCGAAASLVTLARLHDRSLERVWPEGPQQTAAQQSG